ncbi:MAG: recombination mediator RecR [Planctomycetota bacterium]
MSRDGGTVLAALVDALERLPGIGARTARRLAEHLLRVPESEALALADALRAARARLKPCSRCAAPAEVDPCPRCADTSRRDDLLLVVETLRDRDAVEATGRYEGRYFVLAGRLAPLEGRDVGDIGLDALRARVDDGRVREVVLATNPDLEGDGAARAIARALADLPVRVTRLARGVPTGGQIEHQNAAAITDALRGRRPLDDANA